MARVGRVLQNLRLEDVLANDAEENAQVPADGWSQQVFTLGDGSTVTVQTAEAGDDRLLRLDIAAADEADSELTRAAQRTSGRIFTIQGYKFNDTSLSRDDLVESTRDDDS